MAAISEIYSKRVYFSKLQHRSLVKVQPLQLQLGVWSRKQLIVAVNQEALQ